MKKNKFYSCEDLQGSIYFGPDALRHCCQRFFVNGKMEGDVEILKVKSDNDINVESIISEKKKLLKVLIIIKKLHVMDVRNYNLKNGQILKKLK